MLLRIGKRIINLDNVTEVAPIGDSVRVFFNVTAPGDFGYGPDFTQFSEAEAAALWAFLTDHAVDVLAPDYDQEPQATSKCLACGAEVPGEPQACPECGADYVPF